MSSDSTSNSSSVSGSSTAVSSSQSSGGSTTSGSSSTEPSSFAGSALTGASLDSIASMLDVVEQTPDDDPVSKRDQVAGDLKSDMRALAAIPRGDSWKANVIFYVKSLSGLLSFLIFINGIGALLWFTDSNSNVAGSHFIYWCFLLDIAVVAYFVLRLVLHTVLLILYAIPPVRILYHIVNPFEDLLVLIGTVVGVWVAHTHVLIDIDTAGGDRVEKLFSAFIAACIFFIVKRALVLVIEVLALKETQEDMAAARFWNKVMGQVYKSKPSALKKYEKQSPDRSFSWARNSWLQYVKLPSVASHLRAEGFELIAGKDVPPTIASSPSALGRLTMDIATQLYNHIEDSKAGVIRLKSVLNQYPGHFGRLLFKTLGGFNDNDTLDLETVVARMDVAVKQRVSLLNTLNGRLLLKYVADSILRVIIGFIVLFLVLGAFDIDLLVLMLPFASFALALSFSFSGLVRDFVTSLHMIFFVQPYDLGDLVVIDGKGPFRVLSVSVMTTTFQSIQGYRVTMPNAKIASSRIQNHRKSSNVIYTIDHILKSNLSVGDLSEMKSEFQEWLRESPRIYAEDANMFVVESRTDESVTLRTWVTIKAPWQARPVWLGAASAARLQLNQILEEAGVEFGVDYKIKQD